MRHAGAAQTQYLMNILKEAASVVMSPSDKCFCFFGKGTWITAIHVCGYNYPPLAILSSSLKLSMRRVVSRFAKTAEVEFGATLISPFTLGF
jgi:hypothetical protein